MVATAIPAAGTVGGRGRARIRRTPRPSNDATLRQLAGIASAGRESPSRQGWIRQCITRAMADQARIRARSGPHRLLAWPSRRRNHFCQATVGGDGTRPVPTFGYGGSGGRGSARGVGKLAIDVGGSQLRREYLEVPNSLVGFEGSDRDLVKQGLQDLPSPAPGVDHRV
jgi:hypothetical protein